MQHLPPQIFSTHTQHELTLNNLNWANAKTLLLAVKACESLLVPHDCPAMPRLPF